MVLHTNIVTCYLEYQDSRTKAVVFYNLSGYDAHVIIRDIAARFVGKVKVLASQLPPKEKFYSTLSDALISDQDYQHAQQVWSEFDLKTLGQYI